MSAKQKGAQNHRKFNISEVLEKLVEMWAVEISTPRSLAFHILFSAALNGDVVAAEQLAGYTFPVEAYPDYEDIRFMREYQLWYYVKTYPCYPGYGEEVRQSNAMEKWLGTEEQCLRTDERLFNAYMNGGPGVQAFFEHVQRYIARVLGRFPLNAELRHGSGSVVGASGVRVHPAYRYVHGTATSSAMTAFNTLKGPQHVHLKSVDYVAGCNLTFVPKDAFEERIIAIEPSINMQGQLYIGDAIMRRLRKVGIKIKSNPTRLQQLYPDMVASEVLSPERNQIAALLGSCFDTYATIDAKSSGDHWTYLTAVIFLQKADPLWLYYITRFRSEKAVLPNGDVVSLRKLATAGNGFLFPIQTLFYRAVVSYFVKDEEEHHEFGDDVTVPSLKAGTVMQALKFVGHTINEKKSYSWGPFRESCGFDVFNGRQVKKTKAKTHDGVDYDDYLVQLHNSLYDIFVTDDELWFGRTVLNHIRTAAKLLGRREHHAVPKRHSDGGFVSCEYKRHNKGVAKNGMVMYKKHTYRTFSSSTIYTDSVGNVDSVSISVVNPKGKQKEVVSVDSELYLQLRLGLSDLDNWRHAKRKLCIVKFTDS